MGFRRSVPWTSQPQGAREVDWSNPISRGLAFLWSPIAPFLDVATNKGASLNGVVPTLASNASGVSMQGSATGDISFGSRTDIGVSGSASITMFAVFFIRSNVNMAAAGFIFGKTQITYNFGLYFPGSEQVTVELPGSPSAAGWPGSAISNFFANNGYTFRPVPVCATWDGTTVSVYVDGQLKSTTSFSASFASSTDPFGMLSRGDGSNELNNVDVSASAIWNRCLSPQEVSSVSANPWQLFAPQRRSLGGISGTISRPGTDVSVAGWSFTAASLAGSINEATRDDASYTQAPYGVAGAITTLDLPLVAGSYTLSFAGQYLAANASSGQFRFTALDSSNTSLGVSAWTAVTSSAALYTVALTVSGGTATRLKIEIQA